MLIIGLGRLGKTSILFKMLFVNGWLDYNKLYVYSKSLDQPEYKTSKVGFDKGYSKSDIVKTFKGINNIKAIAEYIMNFPTICKPKISVAFYANFELLLDPSKLNCNKKSLFMFDDIMLEKSKLQLKAKFTRKRHNNCSCIYISQNYHRLPG